MCFDYSITENNFQALDDSYISAKTGAKKQRPWRAKKMANELLATAYDEIDKAKAIRLRECAKILSFRLYENGVKTLDSMNSCRVRLCPMCSWRRSLKNFYNNLKVAEWLAENDPGEWLHLTLTIKNVGADDLNTTIDTLMYAFKKFMMIKEVKKAVKGFYRGLEVTHDCLKIITKEDFAKRGKYLKSLGFKVGDSNPTFDTYHPHFHVLLHVNKSYFKSRDYMSAEKWAKAWQQALQTDYIPSVKVQRLKDYGSGIKGAIAEVSKYATKSSDVLCVDDWDLTVETVRVLDKALANRRLIAYGGSCLKAQKALKLEDADNGDLVNVGQNKELEGLNYEIINYAWHTGYSEYGKIN